jgi:hypothetical protein
MKRYVFFFLLLIFVPTAPAQPSLLASVEIVETATERALPVKKKKLKKKKRYKKPFRNSFKKPNKLKRENRINVKLALLFNMIATGSLAVVAVILAILIGGWNAAFLLVVAGVCLLISLHFLIIFLIYLAVKNKKRRRRRPDKKIVVKKSEKDLRAEVPYLSEGKIKLYLALNEELATAKIHKDILIRNNREKSREEWQAAKVKIKELDEKIKHSELQIQELRRQNKIKKVRRERT